MLVHLNALVAEKGVKGYEHDEKEWLIFCKNVKECTFTHMRSIAEEMSSPDWASIGYEF